MPPTTQRSPNPTQPFSRKDEIVERTFELVSEHGLAGLRMRMLADKVGVSEAALYRHFPSKEAILLALVDRMEARLLKPIRLIASQPDLSPRVKLEEILRHHLRTVIDSKSLPLLLISEASFSDLGELRERMRGFISSYLEILESLAQQVDTRGDLQPREISVLLLGLPAGVALRQRLLPDEELAIRLTGSAAHSFIQRLIGD